VKTTSLLLALSILVFAAPSLPGEESAAKEDRLEQHRDRVQSLIDQRKAENETYQEDEEPEESGLLSQRLVLSERSAPISRIIDRIEGHTGVEIMLQGISPEERLIMMVGDVRLEEALDMMAAAKGWKWYQKDAGRIVLMPADETAEESDPVESAQGESKAADGPSSDRAKRLAAHEKRIRELIQKRRQEQKAAEADEPAAGEAEERVTIAAHDGRIDRLLEELSAQTDATIIPMGEVPGSRVSIMAEDKPLEDVLSMLSEPNDWVWWRQDDGRYAMADRGYYEQEVLPDDDTLQKVFRPKNVKASELERAIQGLLTSNVGSSVVDKRTNKLIVNDQREALERIEQLVEELDARPRKATDASGDTLVPTGDDTVIRTFHLEYAHPMEFVAAAKRLGLLDGGRYHHEQRTNRLFVRSDPESLDRLAAFLDAYDVPEPAE